MAIYRHSFAMDNKALDTTSIPSAMPHSTLTDQGGKQDIFSTIRNQLQTSSDDMKQEHQQRQDAKTATPPLDSFHQLVQNISDTLGPTSGLDTPDIDPQTFINLMQEYTSTASTAHQWTRYAYSDPSRSYTRNLVCSTNPNANILLLVWNPGKSSPIHDHANAHCVMKVLQGSLQETLYDNPTTTTAPPPQCSLSLNGSSASSSSATTLDGAELQIKKQTIYTANQVTYISDQIGLHRISNPSQTEVAISLHLYTPPHAANFGFNMFDERTGHKMHVRQGGYYSEQGRRCRM